MAQFSKFPHNQASGMAARSMPRALQNWSQICLTIFSLPVRASSEPGCSGWSYSYAFFARDYSRRATHVYVVRPITHPKTSRHPQIPCCRKDACASLEAGIERRKFGASALWGAAITRARVPWYARATPRACQRGIDQACHGRSTTARATRSTR